MKVITMSMQIRLIIDSVFEDLVRIIAFTTIRDRKIIDTNVQSLATILDRDKIVEGGSYRVVFEDIDDLNSLLSGVIDETFVPKGRIELLDRTAQDLSRVRRVQRKLGLR